MVALTPLSSSKRIVIKIGSALLIDSESGKLRADWLQSICDDIASLKSKNIDLIIVSSGAVALGRQHLSLIGQLTLPQKQACAAVGQSELTRAYERALAKHDIITAQTLLTLTDTENRRRWLNAKSTMETLLTLGAVPIVNENDTVATDEIRYGDNDRLAARVAQMIGADTLILLSDIDGLYTVDPRKNNDAQHIAVIEDITPEIMAMGGKANMSAQVGTGGMATKLLAAKLAVDAGCSMIILDGSELFPIKRLNNGAKYSWFKAQSDPAGARAQWIKGSLSPKGNVSVDKGAVKALQSGASLLAAGISQVSSSFTKGSAIRVLAPDGSEIGRGLVNYSADEILKIKGVKSDDIVDILGYKNGAAVIHRDNMVLTS